MLWQSNRQHCLSDPALPAPPPHQSLGCLRAVVDWHTGRPFEFDAPHGFFVAAARGPAASGPSVQPCDPSIEVRRVWKDGSSSVQNKWTPAADGSEGFGWPQAGRYRVITTNTACTTDPHLTIVVGY
jgi:hypothetical protein